MQTQRLGQCEVCADKPAKYTCPECEVKTCSIPCINIHKKELNCSGTRNRVKYKPLHCFTNSDLQSDYILLEEARRSIDRIKLADKQSCRPRIVHTKLDKLRRAAQRRKVRLEFLPEGFTRRKDNTTYLDWKTDTLYWKVEWVFPNANNLKVIEERIVDTTKIGSALSKYICPKKCDRSMKEVLSYYHSRGFPGTTILFKCEKEGQSTFSIVECYSTFRQALQGKTIIEHPVFYIVFSDFIDEYNILHSDDEDDCENGVLAEESNFFFGTVDHTEDAE